LHLIRLPGEKVTPIEPVNVFRDANDNKFLEVAVSAAADYLVSKDDDLLTLSHFEGIAIITPADFLEKLDYGTTDE
jgi:predicted nucleic acid-binding protein